MTDEASDLMAAATEATGLDNFGPDSFREGLDVYCSSLTEEAQLSDLGTVALQGTVTASLVNRLRVIDWAEQHPAVLDETIDSPVIVIGMFRAGTTFLSYLLDQDRTN